MIRRWAVLVLLLLAGEGRAEGPDPEPTEEGEGSDPLAPYRERFDTLAERTIGTASRPVAYDWRRTTVQLAAMGAFPFELNNFNALRAGAVVRAPSRGMVLELGVSWAHSWDSPSSRLLALTPYRQPGRPSRLELDLGVAFPVAEGVVTFRPRFLPAAQLVLNLHGGLRYLLYPTAFQGLNLRQTFGAIFAPSLSDREVDNLDTARLDAMQVDRGRYGLMVGLGTDLYLEQGLFLSPRMMVAVPLLAPVTRTDLTIWAEANLCVGMAF